MFLKIDLLKYLVSRRYYNIQKIKLEHFTSKTLLYLFSFKIYLNTSMTFFNFHKYSQKPSKFKFSTKVFRINATCGFVFVLKKMSEKSIIISNIYRFNNKSLKYKMS